MILTHTLESTVVSRDSRHTHTLVQRDFLLVCVCVQFGVRRASPPHSPPFPVLSLLPDYTIYYFLPSRKEKAQKKNYRNTTVSYHEHHYYYLHYTAILHTDGFDTKFLSSHWPHYKSCHSRVRPFFYASVSPYHPLYDSLLHTKSYYRHTVFNHLKPCCTPTYKTPNFLGFSFPKKRV